MRAKLTGWLGVTLLMACLGVTDARANELAVGVEAGAAMPAQKFRSTAHVGGHIAPSLGYRFDLGETFAVTLLGETQFAGFPTQLDPNPSSSMTGLFSLTGGARFSLIDGNLELFFSPKGGYYWAVSGPPRGEDGGFNLTGGLSYEVLRGLQAGIYVRRDQTGIDPQPGLHKDTAWISAGLSAQYRFLPPLAVVAEAPPPPPEPAPAPPVKQKIVLRGVHFDFDKANIRADARPILDEAVHTLKIESGITVAVEGHTDSRGSDAYNDKLSKRRAQAVADYLAEHGIALSRLSVAGFGESHPVASNDTSDGRAQNRRVELRVTDQ